jgi:ribosomal protein S27AE
VTYKTEYYERDGLKGVKGEEPICPKCGHYNAMLTHKEWNPWAHVYECRDCGYVHGTPQSYSPEINEVVEILDNIIFMATQTKEVLTHHKVAIDSYNRLLRKHLDDTYRSMSFAAIHEE